MRLDKISYHPFLHLLDQLPELSGGMLNRSLDIADKNFTVVMAAGDLVQFLPIYGCPVLLFDIG
ncbi:hypothetical protein D3C72_2349380 [compost metagenome]